MPKSKLRHIAISVDDPFATAESYKQAFMKQVGQTDSCLAIPSFNSDRWAGDPSQAFRGIHPMGFWVDSVDVIDVTAGGWPGARKD